jgi:alpha-glucosidase
VQVGAFMPFFRIHSMIESAPQEPWAFGPEVEAIARRYIEWRYRLLPYLYTAVWQAAQTGLPIARALSLAFPDDPTTYSLDDEFLLGDSVLVAPVVEKGAASREVTLPAGRWFDFWTGARHDGPVTITASAPLDVLPLYVRAGSVIPIWPVMQHVGEHAPDTLTLRVYLGEGESRHYEDDGESVAPAHRLTTWEVTDTTITARAHPADYQPGYERLAVIVFGLDGAPSAVEVTGTTLLEEHFDAREGSLHLSLDYADGYTVRIEP